ncbi:MULTISPECIES: gamma-glutamyl-gamma-aminobutyrate hydrolase family protein [Photorhabdus]|nr:gamma-glutamyl-gamma-aminobutyrate hydrolase family protein [Photorhabdus asymbiotica]
MKFFEWSFLSPLGMQRVLQSMSISDQRLMHIQKWRSNIGRKPMALLVNLRGPGLMIKRPIVGVSCCLRSIAFGDYPPTPHHTVFHKYVDFVVRQLKAVPILLPATPEIANSPDGYNSLISRLDGVLLTGSPSNVGVRWQKGKFTRILPVGLADHERD